MNIVLAADDNYAIPCMVTISSILENNDNKKCNIYVLTVGFNKENQKLFNNLQTKYKDAYLKIKTVNPDKLKGAITSERFPLAIFFRLLIPYILECDKVLYLDCDIIVNTNIEEMYDTDLTGCVCGMVEDQACEDITLHNRISTFTPYYNSGVLLMNVSLWRKENLVKKTIDYILNNPECCLYPDQDAINAIFPNRIKPLPYRYNFQERWYEPKQYWLMHRSKWDTIEEAKKSPAILHYTGPHKPWMDECYHPLQYLFTQYKKNVIKESNGKAVEPIDEDIKVAEAKQRERAEIAERKRRHRHIRRANLFMTLFIIETVLIIAYLLCARF